MSPTVAAKAHIDFIQENYHKRPCIICRNLPVKGFFGCARTDYIHVLQQYFPCQILNFIHTFFLHTKGLKGLCVLYNQIRFFLPRFWEPKRVWIMYKCG